MSRRRRSRNGRRSSVPEREEAGSTLFIDPATRANLELLRTLSGSRDGSLFKAIDRTVTGAGARLLADRLMSPLTDPAAINRRLDSVALLDREPRLCEALARHPEGVADMPRALIAAGAQPRWAARPRRAGGGLRGGGSDRRAACAGACCRRNLRRPLAAITALPAGLAAHLDSALDDELPLLKRDGGFVRARL